LAKQFPVSLRVRFFLQNGYQKLTGVDHPINFCFHQLVIVRLKLKTSMQKPKPKLEKMMENNGK